MNESQKDPALVTFDRLAVTPEQIASEHLVTRLTKTKDRRAKKWIAAEEAAGRSGESVEVDAIPPARLREIVREGVIRHLDRDACDATLAPVSHVSRESLTHSHKRLACMSR